MALATDTPEIRQEVLNWISSKGIDPTSQKIDWVKIPRIIATSTPRPAVKKEYTFHINSDGTAEVCVDQAYPALMQQAYDTISKQIDLRKYHWSWVEGCPELSAP